VCLRSLATKRPPKEPRSTFRFEPQVFIASKEGGAPWSDSRGVAPDKPPSSSSHRDGNLVLGSIGYGAEQTPPKGQDPCTPRIVLRITT